MFKYRKPRIHANCLQIICNKFLGNVWKYAGKIVTNHNYIHEEIKITINFLNTHYYLVHVMFFHLSHENTKIKA
jgi:hypothetical protein